MPLLDLQQHLKQELLNNPFLDMVEEEEDEDDEEGATEEGEQTDEEKQKEETNDEIDWEEILLDGFDAGGRREEHEEQRVLRAGHRRYAATSAITCAIRSRCSISTPRQHAPRRRVHRQHQRGRLSRVLRSRRSSTASTSESRRPPRSRSATSTTCRSTRWPKCEEMLAIDPGARSAGRRRARPARVPAAPAPRSGARAVGAVPPRARLLRRADQPPLERDLQALRHQRRRRPERRRRDREARSEAGSAFTATASDNYIIPDLVVDKIDGKYHVFLNDANLPRLKLSRAYQEIARDKKKFDGENKEFISNKLNSANWMIQAIEQRRQTMLKVMNYIVDRQRDFFEKGVQYLKPLTLREVAEVINMHESHGQPRDEREVRADAARRAAAQVLLLVGPLDHRRRRRVGARHQGADREARVGRGSEASAHRSGDRQHPEGERRPDRAPHRRQVSRPARRPLGAHAQAGMTAVDRRGTSLRHDVAAIDVSVLVPAKDEAENLPLFMEQAAAAFANSTVHVRSRRHRRRLDRRHAGACSSELAEAVSVSARRASPRADAASPTRCAPAISHARGDVLVFYPADLQFKPEDIPRLVAPILAGESDMVTGYKQGEYEKAFVSRIYNGLEPLALRRSGAAI